jgi:hypothetical protein
MDELRQSPQTLLTRVQRFLELPELDLIGDAVHAENETKSELRRHARRDLVAQLKSLPVVPTVARALNPTLRERAVDLLFRSPVGARVARSFEPPPMRENTRARLLERFAPSMLRLESLMDQDFSDFFV